MLKTLRVTSFVTVILAAVGVVAIVVLGLKGDPEISDFLAKPGIVDELRGQAGQKGEKEDKSSPLVALAKAVALRFDPPPPPKPPVVKDAVPKEVVRVKPSQKFIPEKKGPISAKFDLLATVVYETAPERSLALLKTASNKQEWLRQGEKAGHLEVHEIRDGSVVFTQGGGKPQEVFVPAKPQIQPLLKGEQSVSITRPGSITDLLSTSEQIPTLDNTETVSTPGVGTSERTTSGKVRMVRPRSDVSERIQRVRSTPPPLSAKEQKEELDETVSGIKALMNRQDETFSAEERKKENEMWQQILKDLNAEKKELEAEIKDEEPSEKDSPASKNAE